MKESFICHKTECFANTMMGCRILTSCYVDRECPFYKTKTQVKQEKENNK